MGFVNALLRIKVSDTALTLCGGDACHFPQGCGLPDGGTGTCLLSDFAVELLAVRVLNPC